MAWFYAGGWNPHRGFRHSDPTDSHGCIGASVIARRIALLRAAIHPPLVRDVRGVFEWWPPEVGIRTAASDMAVYLIHSAISAPSQSHDGLRCFAPLSILRSFEICAEFSNDGLQEVGIRIAASDMAV